MTDLSICIPTFNRADRVATLVRAILAVLGDFEICVHDDGSADDTTSRLSTIDDPRLRLGRGENGGRGQALHSAIRMATGRFVMIFDDDDQLFPEGLELVLSDCKSSLPKGCVGRIYHMVDETDDRGPRDFPIGRSNLIALRADHGVTGDKKEVVLRAALLEVLEVPGKPRRIPTSLYWARLALGQDVLCVNAVIGMKNYLAGGMTDTLKQLKRDNAMPLLLVHKARLSAFRHRRYKSWRYALRSLIAVVAYGVRTRKHRR